MIALARPKPDNYERLQIVLGDKERQLLEDYRFAYMFNRVSTPIVDLLKDISGIAVLYIILSSLFPGWSSKLNLNEIDAFGDDDKGLVDYLSGLSLGAGLAGAAGGYVRGGPFGAFVFGVLGLVLGEAGDDVTQRIRERGSEDVNIGFTLLMIKLRGIYQGVKGAI